MQHDVAQQKQFVVVIVFSPTYVRTHARCFSSLLLQLYQARTRPKPRKALDKFWMDDSLDMALATIESYGIYTARIVDTRPGMICIQEIPPPAAVKASVYVGLQRNRYTEKECRAICLQLAQAIQIMHDSGIAHRNIHDENTLIDIKSVSSNLLSLHIPLLLYHCRSFSCGKSLRV